jgi:hypothetical protein
MAMAESSWCPIRYRDFHDVPRMVVFECGGDLYLLDSAFDDAKDDYADSYEVYRLGAAAGERLAASDDWRALANVGVRLGSVPVRDVAFDETRRRTVDASCLKKVTR